MGGSPAALCFCYEVQGSAAAGPMEVGGALSLLHEVWDFRGSQSLDFWQRGF